MCECCDWPAVVQMCHRISEVYCHFANPQDKSYGHGMAKRFEDWATDISMQQHVDEPLGRKIERTYRYLMAFCRARKGNP